jgi:hypothetical protein
MARKKSGQVYVASDSGHAEIKGVPYAFHKGITRVREGHPITGIDGFRNIFEPVDESVHFDTEQATAAPEEARDVTLAGDATGSLEDMTVVELRDYAKHHGVGTTGLSKQELIDAVSTPAGEDEE